MNILDLTADGDDLETAWGDRSSVEGAWATVTRKNGIVTLKRDPWGLQTLYYRVIGNQLRVSPFLELISKDVLREHDKTALAQALLFDSSDFERTFYPSISAVAPGQTVFFDGTSIRKSNRILPTADQEFEGEFSEAVDKWKRLLDESVVKKLLPFKKVGVFASGGLDSSGLMAVIASLIKSGRLNLEVKIYHLNFDVGPGHGQGVARHLADTLGFGFYEVSPEDHHAQINFNKSPDWKDLVFAPTFQFYELLLKKAKQDNCEAVIFGYGADEQLTPSYGYLSNFLRSGKWLKFLKNIFSLLKNQESPRILISAVVSSLLPQALQQWVVENKKVKLIEPLAAEPVYQKVKIQMTRNWREIPNQINEFFRKQMWIRNLSSGIAQSHKSFHEILCRKWGVECVCPYVDADLIRFSQSLPLEFLKVDNHEKLLLRTVLEGRLEDRIRLKEKFQDYTQFVDDWVRSQRAQFTEPTLLAEMGLVSLEKWKKQLAQPINQDNSDILLQIQFIENWLQFQYPKESL